jgi:hypothetical protein
MIRLVQWTLIFPLVLAAGLHGCRSATPPVQYYVLSPVERMEGQPTIAGRVDLTIGIMPVELPGIVNRQQMVLGTGSNRIQVAELHRWADYPDRLVQQMLGDNLQLLLPRARVVNAPWPVGVKPDVTVAVQILELIGVENEHVRVSAQWTVTDNNDPSGQYSGRTDLIEKIDGSGYDALAAAHSRGIGDLCREVAAVLDNLR